MPTSAAASAGRVVDAVAGHRHPLAARLQPLDDLRLLLRQHVGLDPIDPDRARDRFGRGAVIAGEHHHGDALTMERLNGCGRRLLDGIGDADEARRLSVHGDEHHRLALAPQRLSAIAQRAGVDAERLEVSAIADGHGAALDTAGRRPCR
jgi:hypothetical protein